MILNVNLPPLKNVPKPSKRELDLHQLANMVAEKHYLTSYELKMKKRSAVLVDARVDFAKEAINEYTLEEIGEYLGRHHSSVVHYLKGYKERPFRGVDTRQKLSEPDIPKIRRLYSDGMKQKDIAPLFNVTSVTISNIVNRKTWSHV